MRAEWNLVSARCAGAPITTATVRLRGDLDASARALLAEHLAPLAAKRLDGLEADLAGVGFMDCAAAGILVNVGRAALPPGDKLVLVRASSQVRRLLHLSGLEEDCLLLC